MRDESHQFSAGGGFEVEFLLQGGDVVLLTAEFVLVLVVDVFDLGEVLLHHVALANQVVDVLLLFVGLLINPLDFASQGRDRVGSGHFLVKRIVD